MNKLLKIRVNEYCLKYYSAILDALRLKNPESEICVGVEEFIKVNRSPKLKEKFYWNTRNTVRQFDKQYNKNRLYWYFARKGIVS